jgi:MurNAc alpha-1-phosphate uridylyltransferase
MQAVILAGGLGTRLRPLTETIPKAMAPVCGRPFLEYQLDALARSGIRDVIICLGHLGHMIEDHFGDGRRFGLSIRYGYERERLLGTAGAVKNVEGLLDDAFFVLYGDSYLVVDYPEVMRYFLSHDRVGLMVVLRNEGRWDRSNVVLDGDFVAIYDKAREHPGMVYTDFGVSAFRREALSPVPVGVSTDLSAVFHDLIGRRQLLAYETSNRFYQIGSPQGLQEFEGLIRSGALPDLAQA